MSFLSKTALGLVAATGLMVFTTPQAEARHYRHGHSSYVRVYSGHRYYHSPRRVVYVRDYDPYYYDSYYGSPRYSSYGYGGPSFSFAFGGHGHHGSHHGHHGHHR